MKLSLKYLVPTGVFAVLVVFFALQLRHGDPGQLPSALIGKTAPAFSLESLGDPGWRVGSADYAGKAWLLNVWATWCVGCRDEHEVLLAISQANRVPIVGLNWRDERTLALRWLAELGNPYASVAYDPLGRTAIDWGVYGAPETFLIGADGIVIKKHVGPLSMDAWEREFLPLLGGGKG